MKLKQFGVYCHCKRTYIYLGKIDNVYKVYWYPEGSENWMMDDDLYQGEEIITEIFHEEA